MNDYLISPRLHLFLQSLKKGILLINPGSRVFQIIRELLDNIAIMICEY